MSAAFQMMILEAPPPKLKAQLSAEISLSGKPTHRNAIVSTHRSERMVLPARSRLEFDVIVSSWQGSLPTGIFKLKFRPLLKTVSGKGVPANNDLFTFEIRSAESFEDRLEVLRRQATRLLANGEYQGADKKLNQLLLLYPNSSISYTLKGHMAMAQGKKDEAARAYKRALDLLQFRRDTIYSSYASSISVEHSMGMLSATLQSLQRSQ